MMLLCERMVQHQLYSSAAVLVAAGSNNVGKHSNLSPHTSFRSLLTKLAAHLSGEAEILSRGKQLEEEQAPYGPALGFDDDYFELEADNA